MKRFTLVAVGFTIVAASACSRDPSAAAQKYVARGDRYVKDGKYREAAIEYGNAVKQQPTSVPAHERLADASMRSHDPASTFHELLELADLEPSNVAAQVRAGALFLLAGRFGDARDRARAALQLDTGDASAALILGQALAGLDDRAGSAQTLREAVRLAPTSAGAHLALAEREWADGEMTMAEPECRRALDLDPDDLQANRAMALLYMATGRPHLAEPLWKKISAAPDGDRFALSDFYVLEGRLDESTALLESLRRDKTLQNEADVRLAGIAYTLGRKADAWRRLGDLLGRDSNFIPGLLLDVRFLMAEGKLTEALAAAQRAERAAPQSADAVYLEGVVDEASRALDGAADRFAHVLELEPEAAAAALAIARVRLQQGRTADVAEWTHRAWQSQPTNLPVRLAAVHLLLGAGELGAAEERARANASEFPRLAETHADLGRALHAAHKNDEARRAFQAALAIEPDSIEALEGMAAVDVEEHRAALAGARLDAELRANPRSPDLLILAGWVAAQSGADERAESLLKRALEADATKLAAYELLGELYLRQKQLAPALDEFRRAEREQPDVTGASTMVGIILEAQGRPADARAQYERVLARNPRAAIAGNNLAWLLVADNRLDDALRLASMAHEELRTTPEIDDTLGWIYARNGRHAEAIRTLAEAVEANPARPLYRYHLGMAFLEAGDVRNAVQELDKALASGESFPGREDASAALRRAEDAARR